MRMGWVATAVISAITSLLSPPALPGAACRNDGASIHCCAVDTDASRRTAPSTASGCRVEGANACSLIFDESLGDDVPGFTLAYEITTYGVAAGRMPPSSFDLVDVSQGNGSLQRGIARSLSAPVDAVTPRVSLAVIGSIAVIDGQELGLGGKITVGLEVKEGVLDVTLQDAEGTRRSRTRRGGCLVVPVQAKAEGRLMAVCYRTVLSEEFTESGGKPAVVFDLRFAKNDASP